jgi:hypothetical protein
MSDVLRKCVKRHSLSHDSSGSGTPPPSIKNSTNRTPSRSYTIDQQDGYALPMNIKKLPELPDYESFEYMTLTEAVNQHKIVKNGKIAGDLKTAYKCLEAYANFTNTSKRNQIMAKNYKAVYISRGFVEGPPNKDKIVADLFKEVADDEENEFPDAKVRYADCLYKGLGVEKNESEALKYFEKAAKDGLKVAMYNAGNMYFNGIGCEKDKEKAKEYMELAVINGYGPAIGFLEKYNL